MSFYELTTLVPMWFLRLAAFGFGLLWGSFLNVVIYRVPREMSVVRPASHCPACGKPVPPLHNVPVLSYLVLRGRARCCGAKMSPRYLAVELIGGAVSIAIFEAFLVPLGPQVSLVRATMLYFAYFSVTLALVAAAFIDIEHMFLPDSITLGGVVVGIATATIRDMSTFDAVLGAAWGFAGVWFPFTFLYKGLRGRTGMGVGDAKLVALAGAWFGWPGAVFVLFAGGLQGTVYTIVLKVLGITPKLPQAVIDDLAELEKAAEAGDAEAKALLEDDPLVEEENPFILVWLWKLFGKEWKAEPPEDDGEAGEADEGGSLQEQPMRIPFGPFLILGVFEVLFFGTWLSRQVHILGLD